MRASTIAFLISYGIALWYIGQELTFERHLNLARTSTTAFMPQR